MLSTLDTLCQISEYCAEMEGKLGDQKREIKVFFQYTLYIVREYISAS